MDQSELEEILGGMRGTRDLITELRSDVREGRTKAARASERLASVERRLDTLAKIIVEGNGARPIVTRMALVEAAVDGLTKSVAAAAKDGQADAASRRQVIGAIIVAGISLLGSVLVALLK